MRVGPENTPFPLATRRQLFRVSASAIASAWLARELVAQSGKHDLGMVVSQPFELAPATWFRAVAQAGVTTLEGSLPRLKALASHMSDAGLRGVSAFIPTPMITGNWPLYEAHDRQRGQSPASAAYALDAAIADARALGLRNLVINNLLPGERRTLDDYKRFAEQMRVAAERCSEAGLALYYHPHSFEYEPLDGIAPVDMLAERLAGANSGLEVDVFWVAMAGRDPAAFIRQHAESTRALHLKDRSKAAPVYVGPQYEAPAGLRVLMGTGSIDFRAVIEAADAAGVGALYVEDESPGDRLDNTLKSVAYLRHLGI